MSEFVLRFPAVAEDPLDQNLWALLEAINTLARFIDYGTGVPTHTPTSVRFYIRYDAVAGAAIYAWNSAAWVALA